MWHSSWARVQLSFSALSMTFTDSSISALKVFWPSAFVVLSKWCASDSEGLPYQPAFVYAV